MTFRNFLTLAVALICLTRGVAAGVEKTAWGESDGQPVTLFTLRTGSDVTVRLTDYGARLVGIEVPDRNGNVADVTLGFDNLAGYQKHRYFGATVGRVANRIAKGKFTLDGKDYTLAVNNGPNHLHGGKRGFDRIVWTGARIDGKEGPAVRFRRRSADGEEGYPGNVDVAVTYTLLSDKAVRIDYEATTDARTPVNLSNHTYFNLAGVGAPRVEPVAGHVVTICANRYTPTDDTRIPTGELAPVEGTVMDFRKPMTIGAHVAEVPGQPPGYDHNYVVNNGGHGQLIPVATVVDPKSGRQLDVLSTEPGVQFYTANGFDGSMRGKGALAVPKHAGFCLETQHFPDSVNHPNFPSTILRPGETYRTSTVYRFSIAP
jgi:aldose 1-epimerase